MLCIVNHSLWLFKSVSSPVLPKTVTQQITSFCSGQKNYYVVIAGVDAVVCAPKELILCNPFGFITYSIWGLTTLRASPWLLMSAVFNKWGMPPLVGAKESRGGLHEVACMWWDYLLFEIELIENMTFSNTFYQLLLELVVARCIQKTHLLQRCVD